MSRFRISVYGKNMPNRALTTRDSMHNHMMSWNHGIRTSFITNDNGTVTMSVWTTGGELFPENIDEIYSKTITIPPGE